MTLSPYVRVFPWPERPSHLLAFSTRKGSLALLRRQVLEDLARGRAPAEGEAELRRTGIAVEDANAERAGVLDYLDEVNRRDAGVTAAVFLGLSCNFACPYCFENGLDRSAALAEPTAEQLGRFLFERLHPGKRRLTIDFYGGEPLLYLPRLGTLSAMLQAECRTRGVEYRFTLVTNGSRLTPEVVESLRPLGLASAKVTLDGPPDLHDRSRPFRSGRGTFDTVTSNLRDCAGLLPIAIAGNYTESTWRAFPALLDRLIDEGLGPDRIARVHFGPVLPGARSCAGTSPATDLWVAEAAVALRKACTDRGFRVSRIAPSPCMADLADAFAVGWDGRLYKCPAAVGREEFAVGDVWTGSTTHRSVYGGARWESRFECRKCPYLPLCFGGCRYAALLRNGTMEAVECGKPFWDAALESLALEDARRLRRTC